MLSLCGCLLSFEYLFFYFQKFNIAQKQTFVLKCIQTNVLAYDRKEENHCANKKYHNTQLLFGVRDISVQIGYKRFKSPDAIQFVEVESLPGGVSAEIETKR